MRSITCGKGALNTRREGAYTRLTAHLKDHRRHHDDLTDEQFKSHEKAQEAEYERLGKIISGNASE